MAERALPRSVAPPNDAIIRTGLEPGLWHNADELMLHGCMAILCRYVEEEMGGVGEVLERARWLNEDSEHLDVPPGFFDREIAELKETAEIYTWWKQYPGDPEAGLDHLEGSAYWKAAESNKAKEDEMLTNLIRLRHGMWT